MPDDPIGDANRLTSGEPDRPSSTFLPDWVWMSDAPDQAKVYYWAIRSFIFEKDDQYAYELTDDELAPMMRRSVASVVRARKAAAKHGLIEVLSEQRRSGYTNGRKHSLPVLRTIRVRLDPPEGCPVNVFTEKRRIAAGQVGSADVGNQLDQGDVDNSRWKRATGTGKQPDDQGQKENAAGQVGSSDLQNTNADLQNTNADLHNIAPDDQGKPGPQVPFPSSLPNTPSPWYEEAPPAHTRETDPETEHEVVQSEPTPASNEGEGDSPTGETTDELAWRRERDKAGTWISRELQPATPAKLWDGLSRDEKISIWDLVTRARLLKVPNDVVRDRLVDFGKVTYLGKVWQHRLADIVAKAEAEVADQRHRKQDRPACDRCRAPEGASANERKVLVDPLDPQGKEVPCPDCRHQDAGSAPPEATQAG